MATTTADNVNGVSNGFQWLPGIVVSGTLARLLSHLFEWADFDTKLEHIASTDLLQSVVS